jgi:hypothetical protein
MGFSDILAKVTPYKYYFIVVILILIVVAYYWFFASKAGKSDKSKKGGSKKGKKQKAAKKSKAKAKDDDDEDDDNSSDDDSDDDVSADAKQIYRLAHENLVNGMSKDQFMQVVGDLGDAVTYIHLKQLYTDAAEQGKDPNSITAADYAKAMAG